MPVGGAVVVSEKKEHIVNSHQVAENRKETEEVVHVGDVSNQVRGTRLRWPRLEANAIGECGHIYHCRHVVTRRAAGKIVFDLDFRHFFESLTIPRALKKLSYSMALATAVLYSYWSFSNASASYIYFQRPGD